MSNPEGLAIARRLIAEEAERQTGFLDLGRLGLTELPEEIHQLRHLKRLNLGWLYRDDADQWHESANEIDANNFSEHSLPPLDFPQLESLGLRGTLLRHLTPLAGLTSLQSLDCFDTSVSDLTPLVGLPNLESLSCASTSVSDLSPLAGVSNLESLSCDITSVSDLSPLVGLSILESLSCANTSVSDLSPLAGLSSLRKLSASYCKLNGFPSVLLREAKPIELYLFATHIPGVPCNVLSQNGNEDCRARLLAHVATDRCVPASIGTSFWRRLLRAFSKK